MALQRRLGMTAIYVTHDQSEAMALADRVVLMNAGRIVEIGAPRDLYRQPAHRFTAEFLGHTNILDGIAAGGRVTLPLGRGRGRGVDRRIARRRLLSVRPEDVRLRVAGDGPGRWSR